ncbi:phospholipid phosphatase 2-like [Symsagittifera roscoffensis]|uniref:phospholipid phosphatase 2-like n=1 Tax=Symsagittifera roscoffensis TaxID=84072 RepID=UPI00307C6BE5
MCGSLNSDRNKWIFIGNVLGLVGYTALANCVILTFSEPVDRGVYCGDPSIIYPLKSEIVSGWELVIITTLPVIIIAAMNYFVVAFTGLLPFSEDNKPSLLESCLSVRKVVHICWMENVLVFLVITAGNSTCYLITEIAKVSVGEYRPHFLAVCRPNNEAFSSWGQFNCETQTLMTKDNFNCSADNDLVYDAMKSFPSGHASIGAFAAVFGVIYLQKFLKRFKNICMLKTLIQVCFIVSAWFVAFSRVADNHHHLLDVIIGLLIGCILAIVCVEYCFPTQQFSFGTVGSKISETEKENGSPGLSRNATVDTSSLNFDVNQNRSRSRDSPSVTSIANEVTDYHSKRKASREKAAIQPYGLIAYETSA